MTGTGLHGTNSMVETRMSLLVTAYIKDSTTHRYIHRCRHKHVGVCTGTCLQLVDAQAFKGACQHHKSAASQG